MRQSNLKDQGDSASGAGNIFSPTENNTNNQIYYSGGTPMVYYVDPSYSFSLAINNTLTAESIIAGADSDCRDAQNKIAKPSIRKEAINDLRISPNPASQQILVEVAHQNQTVKSAIKVYSILGVEVRRVDVRDGSVLIDIGDLENGLYFCKFYEDERPQCSKKFIVNHKTIKYFLN